MREIKFRAWNKEEKYMQEPHTLQEYLNDLFLRGFEATKEKHKKADQEYKHIVFMQFTGLTDKNGKEIYEKDICHVNENDTDDGSFDMMGMYGEFGIVKVRKGCVGMELIHTKRWVSIDEEEREVLGNIYENPELLEG